MVFWFVSNVWFLLSIFTGIANNCGISQIGNANGQSQSNEYNEPYDNNSLTDIAVGQHFLHGSQERCSYASNYGAWDVDNVDLSEDFKKHYEIWLQKEVFSIQVDWDSLRTMYDIENEFSLNKNMNSPNAKNHSAPVIKTIE